MTESKPFAHIEAVENGFVVSTEAGQFVFTSVNTALKLVRETMNPKDATE
jgi:hypothetical protein